MDDYSLSSLAESKNEWCARLVSTLAPAIKQGLYSIFQEAWKLCVENNEKDKYLMTFQTFLSRVPKWNETIISTERQRIVETTGCKYLEELITCVHVVQLKALTCVRVGQKQKKVDIDVPSVDAFIHKVYINAARKVYTAVYLFEVNLDPLVKQQRNTLLENTINACILNTVRESVPIENILRAYMGETEEQDVEVKEVVEDIPPAAPAPAASAPAASALAVSAPAASAASASSAPAASAAVAEGLTVPSTEKNSISFSDLDTRMDITGVEDSILAPKTEERLQELSDLAYERRKQEEEKEDEEDDDEGDILSIGGEINLELNDINDLSSPPVKLNTAPLLDGVQFLT